MKPTALSFARYTEPTPEQKFKALGPIAERFGRVPKGTVLPETIVQACPRVKVKDIMELSKDHIPQYYFERPMEHNQQIKPCCRHPENHEIAAFKSHPDEKAPDIYIFYCGCGCRHIRYHAARTDRAPRPIWSAA